MPTSAAAPVPILAILIFGLGLLVGGSWLGLATLVVYGVAIAVGITVVALFVALFFGFGALLLAGYRAHDQFGVAPTPSGGQPGGPPLSEPA